MRWAVILGGDFEAYWRSGGARRGKGGRARRAVPPDHRLFAARCGAHRAVRGGPAGLLKAAATARARCIAFARAELGGSAASIALLDRMLFRAALPKERYRVLERFYRLDEELLIRAVLRRPLDTRSTRRG